MSEMDIGNTTGERPQDAATNFQLGRLLGRMDAMEARQGTHEAFVKENMHGINTKLDELRVLTQQASTRLAMSKAAWGWIMLAVGAFVSQFATAVVVHYGKFG